MQRLVLVALLILCALSFAQGQAVQKGKLLPIVIDDWWNIDYVKDGCEIAARNSRPCPASTPKETVTEFENELEVAFAAESACHGLELLHLAPEMIDTAVKNPAAPATGKTAKLASEQWWTLLLDLDGHSHTQVGSGWNLVSPTSDVLRGRITTPARLAQQICKIAKGVGGKTGK